MSFDISAWSSAVLQGGKDFDGNRWNDLHYSPAMKLTPRGSRPGRVVMVAKKTPASKTRPKAAEAQRSLGRARPDGKARFPVAPPKSELPSSYIETLRQLTAFIRDTRLRTVLSANAAMIQMYWGIGRTILDRQAREGWGAKVVDRLSADLREAFPDMSGLSPRNLMYMRAFAAAWPNPAIVQRALHNLP